MGLLVLRRWHEAALVVGLLVEHTVEIGVNLIDVSPVLDLRLEVVKHIDDLDIGAAVEGALERTDAGCDGGVGVGASGTGDAYGEGRVVAAAVLRLYDKEEVKHAGFELGIVHLEHVEEVLREAEIVLGMADVERAAVLGMAVDIVGVGDDGREAGDELDGLPHEVVSRDVVGIGVKCVHLQDAAGEDIHDVAALEVDDVDEHLVVEGHIVIDELAEGRQFLLVGQFAREDEVGYLLKSEALFLEQRRHEVVELVSSVEELALNGHESLVRVDIVAYDIADIGEADEDACAVLITQAPLDAVFGEEFIVYLA